MQADLVLSCVQPNKCWPETAGKLVEEIERNWCETEITGSGWLELSRFAKENQLFSTDLRRCLFQVGSLMQNGDSIDLKDLDRCKSVARPNHGDTAFAQLKVDWLRGNACKRG